MSDPAPRRKRLPVRWLTLAEVVGLVAVVIAGLGYWDSHRERSFEERERAAVQREQKAEARREAQQGALKQTFLMTGTPESSGERLRLTAVHPEQVIQTQAITFPGALRVDPVQSTGNPRVEARRLEGGLAKALRALGDDKKTEGRVPMGVVTVFIEDGQTKTDRAIYLLGYSLDSRVLRPDRMELQGMSLVRRGVNGDLQAAVDALWPKADPRR